jgi:release factor glutamine methyltransferase
MNYIDLWHALHPLYDDGEAKAIVRLVLEERFGLTMSDIFLRQSYGIICR